MPRYIDADDVIERLDMICDAGGCLSPVTEAVRSFCKGLINHQPTIEAEPVKHGKWENDKLDIPRCSCCSYIPEFNRHIDDYYYSDFCPNCGARMGGGSE